MKRSEKKEFVQKLKEEIDTSSSVIVTHYSGLTVDESDQLRSEMRNNGAKFKVTKNRLTKLALEQTQFKDLADLFTGPTAIAYSDDPVAPAKVAVSFEKKLASSVISFSNQVRCTPGGRLDMSHKFLTVSSIIEAGQITRPTGSNLGSSSFNHFWVCNGISRAQITAEQ